MYRFGAKIVCCIFILLLPVKGVKVPLLIYQPTAPTRIQWIQGIGIPLDNLKFEAMTTGYVLKAEYYLPDNITQLKTRKPMPFQRRKFGRAIKLENFLATPEQVPHRTTDNYLKNNKQVFLSSYRWAVYKALEGLGNRMGLSGRDCVLKSICENAETPFHYYNGLIAELFYILLTPSSSADKLSTHSDNEYYHAEHLGRSGANCHRVFKDCPRSLLDHITDIQNLAEGVMKIMG